LPKPQTSPTICLNFSAHPPPIFLICSSHPLDEPMSRDAIRKWDRSTALRIGLHFYLAKPGPPSREILLLVSSAYAVDPARRDGSANTEGITTLEKLRHGGLNATPLGT
jgi:hypothetical protein